MNSCLTVLQALAANQGWLQVGQFLSWEYGLTERCVEATCYSAAFSWLVTECHLDTMDHQRTPSAIHSTTVLSVELFESLHQQNAAFSFHLKNNTRLLNTLNIHMYMYNVAKFTDTVHFMVATLQSHQTTRLFKVAQAMSMNHIALPIQIQMYTVSRKSSPFYFCDYSVKWGPSLINTHNSIY